MAKAESKPKAYAGAAPTRDPASPLPRGRAGLSAGDVAAAVDRAAAEAGWADPAVVARVRADRGGKVAAALNRLRRSADLDHTLLALLRDATVTLDALHRMNVARNCAAMARSYRADAATLDSMATRHGNPYEGMLPPRDLKALARIAGLFRRMAESYEDMPRRWHLGRKATPEITLLRRVAESLYPLHPVPHEPLRLMAEVALDRIITPATVKAALRSPRSGGYSKPPGRPRKATRER